MGKKMQKSLFICGAAAVSVALAVTFGLPEAEPEHEGAGEKAFVSTAEDSPISVLRERSAASAIKLPRAGSDIRQALTTLIPGISQEQAGADVSNIPQGNAGTSNIPQSSADTSNIPQGSAGTSNIPQGNAGTSNTPQAQGSAGVFNTWQTRAGTSVSNGLQAQESATQEQSSAGIAGMSSITQGSASVFNMRQEQSDVGMSGVTQGSASVFEVWQTLETPQPRKTPRDGILAERRVQESQAPWDLAVGLPVTAQTPGLVIIAERSAGQPPQEPPQIFDLPFSRASVFLPAQGAALENAKSAIAKAAKRASYMSGDMCADVPSLREVFSNDDIIGFIKIEGTGIAYPVVQAGSNEYYLRRGINGEYSTGGTVFMDYESNAWELGDNTVIYGHNMRDGTMFHDIRYYTDNEFFNSHRYITLLTPSGETVWEIFAFYSTTPEFNYIEMGFEDQDAFFGLLLQMKLKSLYDTGVAVGKDDRILTLSTCVTGDNSNRYVLNAKLVSQ